MSWMLIVLEQSIGGVPAVHVVFTLWLPREGAHFQYAGWGRYSSAPKMRGKSLSRNTEYVSFFEGLGR